MSDIEAPSEVGREDESGVRDADRENDDADREDEARADTGPAAHLDDIDDGCGCAEVWEHLSEQRDE
jgi:hypothetical protein